MLRLFARGLLVATVILLGASSAHARGGGGHGGGQGGSQAPNVQAPSVEQPAVSIEKQPLEQPRRSIETQPTAPTTEQFWYYCQPTGGYYPSVQTCAEPWIKVAPKAE